MSMGLVLASPPSSSTADPRMPLDQFWQELAQASLYKKWRTQNPGEHSKLVAYAAGGARPVLATAFGRALVSVVEAQLLLSDPPLIP
jgi:hypothetical protein